MATNKKEEFSPRTNSGGAAPSTNMADCLDGSSSSSACVTSSYRHLFFVNRDCTGRPHVRLAPTLPYASPVSGAPAHRTLLYLPQMFQVGGMQSRDLEALCESFWQWQLKDMPQFATSVGIHDFDHLMDDLSIKAFERRVADVKEFLKQAQDLKPNLTSKDFINFRVLEETLTVYIEGAHFEQ
ncbi:hypothetical protein FHG87_009528 [Trinorchestia longiramus]|nr:hypothetical protein FHG87_009528 [Trinorchestia longiramus]